MATLEKRQNRYRVVLRLNGKKISRSIKSKNETEAQAALARISDGLRRLELGLLTPPDGADVITFLFSDGHVTGKPDAPQLRSLRQLSDAFFASIIKGSLEPATLGCMKTHLSHFKRILGSRFLFAEIQQSDLRRYAEQRLQEGGRRGAKVSPVTIRKELNSLRTVWNWATEPVHTTGTTETSSNRDGLRNDSQCHDTWCTTTVARGPVAIPLFQVFEDYLKQLPAGALAEGTLRVAQFHFNHLCEVLGADTPLLATLRSVCFSCTRLRSRSTIRFPLKSMS